jgi:hypothetical protein
MMKMEVMSAQQQDDSSVVAGKGVAAAVVGWQQHQQQAALGRLSRPARCGGDQQQEVQWLGLLGG